MHGSRVLEAIYCKPGCSQPQPGHWVYDLLETLQEYAEHSEPATKSTDFVSVNRASMRYKEFRAAALGVGSGVVEAGCKVTVGTRLKRVGMHWTVDGATKIIALLSCYLSGRFEDFWEYQAAAPRQISQN